MMIPRSSFIRLGRRDPLKTYLIDFGIPSDGPVSGGWRERRYRVRIFTCVVLLFLLLAGTSLAAAQNLRVGAAQVVISPAAGTPMAGYYTTRLSTGVHDDLHAKAIVLASGDQRAALVACDLVGIPPAVIE